MRRGAGVLSSPPCCRSLNEAHSGWRVCVLSRFSRIQLFATLWTVTHQAPLSMGFYWSGLPCPPPGDLPDPGIKPTFLMSPSILAGWFFTTSATWEAPRHLNKVLKEEVMAQQGPWMGSCGSPHPGPPGRTKSPSPAGAWVQNSVTIIHSFIFCNPIPDPPEQL